MDGSGKGFLWWWEKGQSKCRQLQEEVLFLRGPWRIKSPLNKDLEPTGLRREKAVGSGKSGGS